MIGPIALLTLFHLGMLPGALGMVVRPPVTGRMPLSIAVVQVAGAAVQDDAWIEASLAELSRVYNEFGVYFSKAEVRSLDEKYAALESRSDRDALSAHRKKGFINVFVVKSLRDVDNNTSLLMGVHWAPQGDLTKHYVIVSSTASKTTLAHELGHYFGLPHLHVPDNLMSYVRTGADVFLIDPQKNKVKTNAKVLSVRERL